MVRKHASSSARHRSSVKTRPQRGGGNLKHLATVAATAAPQMGSMLGGTPEAGGGGSYMTMGLLVVILGLIGIIGYLIVVTIRAPAPAGDKATPAVGDSGMPRIMVAPPMMAMATRSQPFSDPLAPPLKNDGVYFPPDSGDVRGIPMVAAAPGGAATCQSGSCGGAVGIPVNMSTRGYSPEFSQVGLLTRERENRTEDTSFRDPMILPLFGRRVMNGRDKYQYYTMSNTGAVNTKLPVKVRGRNCVNEYGCDELMSNDTAYVEGYNDVFRTTVYENGTFSYIPYL